MNRDLIAVFEYLEKEKGIKREIVIQAIEESLRAAARKSIDGASNVTVTIHPKTGDIDVYCEKEIVTEVEVPSQEISLEDARKIDPESDIGQFIDVIVTPKDFGRIAAQKARQVISQKLRGAERDVIYEEYRHRANELISGTVKKFVRGANMIIDLGKVEAMLPMKEYPKTEKYQIGEKVLALLMEVRDTENGGAEVILSRSSPEFVRQLIAQEVPEVADGIIIIDRIVRDAGYRTKLTVRSTDPRIDPVGACVGVRGNRVKNIVRELHSEKIDIIPFSNDPIELLHNALSPIEVRKINLNENDKTISIVVEDDDFAAVIGKKGMNARLNSRLIGYNLSVQRLTDYNYAMMLERNELALTDDPTFDEPLDHLEGINPLVFVSLEDYLKSQEQEVTLRSLLKFTPDQLKTIPGISAEIADQMSLLVLKTISKVKGKPKQEE